MRFDQSAITETRTLDIPTAEVFLPLWQPARYKAAWGGRGSGKSHNFADMLISWAIRKYSRGGGLRFVCVREIQKSLDDSAKLLIEDKIKVHDLTHLFKINRDRIITPGDGAITFKGLQDHVADSIKSTEGLDGAWAEEAHTITDRSWELLRPTIRGPGSEIWASWNPDSPTDAVDKFFRGPTPPPNSVIIKANYYDNPFFTKELEEERLLDLKTNPARYGHIWDGDYQPEAIGAIWTKDVINAWRRHEVPKNLRRILVSVDHATSSKKGSNEHGVIVVGIDDNDHGYILDDMSCTGSPEDWGSAAFAAFNFWDADGIVYERNQGGDLVESNLKVCAPGAPLFPVHASKGKVARAAPISALYRKGKVSHIGSFPELEAQMCRVNLDGYEVKNASPDRMDAMVWGLTELFPQLVRQTREAPETRAPAYHGSGGWMG